MPKRINNKTSSVRIIAGRWRGRRIPVVGEGVRPTGDRVRETLFNWLAPYLRGSRCLDLFAGTGILGLEALSRGAASAVFVERNRGSAKRINELLTKLECDSGEVLSANALQFDLSGYGPFDVVFLDPPFTGPPVADLCTLLEQSGALAEHSVIYMEMDKGQLLPEVPAGWSVQKEQTAGQVRYALARRVMGSEQE
jgi:16S rRNA (guanine966-N2)-methyltransferase